MEFSPLDRFTVLLMLQYPLEGEAYRHRKVHAILGT